MTVLGAILLLALTRAEIVERFRAAPATKLDGLVQVFADCPADMRRDYQLPVAGFVADICQKLYLAEGMRPVRFAEPGIIVHLGDVRTNVADVVAKPAVRDGGEDFTRIYLKAPGHADIGRLRLECAKAFYRAVKGRELDDGAALLALRAADPALKAEDECSELAAWRRGERTRSAFGTEDDERYLKLQRTVRLPGVALPDDVAVFASRLFLYPATFARPFAGRYDACSFREAVELARIDPMVRLAAYAKSAEVVVFGGGRGEKMTAAVDAYVKFLRALAAGRLDDAEITALLDEADAKLKGVLE